MPTIKSILSGLQSENRLRIIPHINAAGMIDLSSNDYLSLGAHCADFREEFLNRFDDADFSSSASRLLSTKQKHHDRLESYLQQLYGKPALLFNSGYHANVGCIGALTLPSTLFVCDKLIHASVVDGLRIAEGDFKRFPHNDMTKLESILNKVSGKYEHIVIVVESIYSMDGDEAPLKDIVVLKKKYGNVTLYVDEAHAFGVRGPRGLGLAEELGLIDDIDLMIGTLGKAAASVGAFAVCSEEMKQLLVNMSRPFIFSTALPPVNVAWSTLMTEKIVGMNQARRNLANLSRLFSERIADISGRKPDSTSQIIPWLTGDAEKALTTAGKLREQGIIALPIRRPTVPPGGERIRFSLCADMEISQLEPVFNILETSLR